MPSEARCRSGCERAELRAARVGRCQGALCHLTLQYIDWLALQLLPDTAETEWLDRHGEIWLVNADGSKGRKMATLSSGIVTFTGTEGGIVPAFTQLSGSNAGAANADVGFEQLEEVTIGPVNGNICARSMPVPPAIFRPTVF